MQALSLGHGSGEDLADRGARSPDPLPRLRRVVAPNDRAPLVRVDGVSRAYGPIVAVDRLSLAVARGELHALLGRNGAGKTTLLRILAGLVTPTGGVAYVGSLDVARHSREARALVGVVPSGDRSFYLRLSALENLVFFGRLQGLRKRAARGRAHSVLAEVGLAGESERPMATYSHGMQKRVSVARAFLRNPEILLVDEATHDLDPEAATVVRALVRRAADQGAAVLWATQRVEEVRGFADRVTLLDQGSARFSGTVSELLARAGARRFVVSLAANGTGRILQRDVLDRALGAVGRVVPLEGDGTYLLSLADGVSLGDALGGLLASGVQILNCRRERPEVEDAFLAIVGSQGSTGE